MGAFIRAANLVKISSVLEVVREKFPAAAEKDERAIRSAFDEVVIE